MQGVPNRKRRLKLACCLAVACGLAASGPALGQDRTPAARAAVDRGAVALMYHRFGEDTLPSTSVRLAQFDAHLEELTSGRYQVMALTEVIDLLRADLDLPDHTVAITIDDAALSVYREAWPRLKARNLPVTLFVSTEPLDLGLPGYMSWAQLREMAADPLVTIGNHGHSHAHMAQQTAAQQTADIETAAARFEAELGSRPSLFAYPYGEISLALRQRAADAGFTAAFGQHSGAIGTLSDRLTLPRFPINEAYGDMDRFRLVANVLPLPVTGITPADMSLDSAAQNPPNVGFTVVSPTRGLDGLNCFSSAGEPTVMRLDQRIELRFAAALPAGRVRVNCTLRAEDGRWRWFGSQFVVAGSPS